MCGWEVGLSDSSENDFRGPPVLRNSPGARNPRRTPVTLSFAGPPGPGVVALGSVNEALQAAGEGH